MYWDRGCLSLRRVKPRFLAEKNLKAFLLTQKKVVFVSQIKVWSCRWACKMPSASPSSPGSCNALIHQNQSHFHELVIGFLAASGQIMSLFLHTDISALVSEANDADCLVNRPGCLWYRAGWQQINTYCGHFVWSPAWITPDISDGGTCCLPVERGVFPGKKKMFQDGLNASGEHRWACPCWQVGSWESLAQTIGTVVHEKLHRVWLVTCAHQCPLWPVPSAGRCFRSSRSAGCAPWNTPCRADSLDIPGWEFEAGLLHPPLPKASWHYNHQSIPPHLCWENRVFYPIPVGVLPWLGYAVGSGDFWAQAGLSVCSSEQRKLQPLLTHVAMSALWAPGLAALASCFGAWNVIIVTLLLSYLPWVLCLPSWPLGWGISAYKIPLTSSGSSWSVWLSGLSWWEIPQAGCVNWEFPFIPSKFTGNYWLTPLLLCYGVVRKERDWSIFSTLPCRVNDILFSCITAERKRSFFITSLINS